MLNSNVTNDFFDFLKSTFTSDKLGLFKEPLLFRENSSEKCFIVSTCEAQNTLIKGGGSPLVTSGASESYALSAIKAIAEGLERYSAGFIDASKAVENTSYNDLLKNNDFKTYDLSLFNTMTEDQYKNDYCTICEIQPTDKITWVKAQGLVDDCCYLVPEEFVYLSYAKKLYQYSNSSGLAAGPSIEFAIRNALLELIERDAIMLSWWTNTAFPELNFSNSTCPKFNQEIEQFKNLLPFIKVAIAKTDIDIPVVIVTYVSNTENKANFAVTASCQLDPKKALIRALREMSQSISFIHNEVLSPESNFICPEPPFEKTIRNFSDAVTYYAFAGSINDQRTFVDSENTVDIDEVENYDTSDPSQDLQFILSKLKSLGFTPSFVDVTSIDAKKSGFHVVRAIEPRLVPLNSSHINRPSAHPRLFSFINSNSKNKSCSIKHLNPRPSPFP